LQTSGTNISKGGGLWIGELYREVNVDTLFGGKTKNVFYSNNWLPCGKPIKLISQNNIVLTYSEGDTYFQRYDCLKTYP